MDLSTLDQSAFNLKHNCNVLEYVLAARVKKGLPSVPEQDPVLDPCTCQDINATHFVYCVRLDQVKKHIINCDPYTLIMLSYAKAKTFGVYYTASAYAITEFINGKICGITSISRWLWEKSTFERIRCLTMFKIFRVAKAFLHWKIYVQCTKRENSKLCLSNLLFLNDAYLQKALIYIHQLCDNCTSEGSSEIVLFDVDKKVTYLLDEFLNLQAQICSAASQQIISLRNSILQVVTVACQQVCAENEIGCLLNDDEDFYCGKSPPHSTVLQWRQVLQYLARFTKLCDQIIMNLLHRLVNWAIGKFLSCIESSSQFPDAFCQKQMENLAYMRQQIQSKPNTHTVLLRYGPYEDDEDDPISIADFEEMCFGLSDIHQEVDALKSPNHAPISKRNSAPVALWKAEMEYSFEDGADAQPSITISPSLNDFCSAVFQTISGIYDVVSTFSSVTSHEELLPYITQTNHDLVVDKMTFNSEWPDIEKIKGKYHHCENKIQDLISITFKDTTDLTKDYDCFLKMMSLCGVVQVPTEQDQQHWRVDKFQHLLAHFSDQIFSIKQMVLSHRIGMLKICAVSFQQTCLTYPMKVLQRIQVFLPSFASQKCDDILMYSKNAIKHLEDSSVGMHAFFLHLKYIEEVKANLICIQNDVTYVAKLFTTAQEFEISVNDHQFALFKSLFPQLSQLKIALLHAEAAKSESISTLNMELCKEINILHHKVQDFCKKYDAFNVLDDSQYSICNANNPITLIDSFLDEVAGLKTELKRLSEYQATFATVAGQRRLYCGVSLTVTAVEVDEQLTNLQDSLSLSHKLWELINEWVDVKQQWVVIPVEMLDINKIQQHIQKMQESTYSLESALPTINFIVELAKEMGDFQEKLDTIQFMMCSPLKARHWEVIQQLPGNKVVNPTALTIQTLAYLKVFDNSEKVKDTCSQAQHEIALESLIKKVSDFWLHYKVVLKPQKSILHKDTYVLENAEALKLELSNSMESLSCIKTSPYIKPFKHAVIDWYQRLLYMNDTLNKWILCQEKYLYYCNTISKDLIKSKLRRVNKVLREADKVWRELIQTIFSTETFMWAVTSPGIWEGFQICSALLEQLADVM